MIERRLAILLGLLSSGGLFADDAETLKLLENASVEAGGKGAIIELEEEKSTGSKTSKTSKTSRKQYGGKQIELIIGGNGEDGVAKRGALVIEE
ncbi:MAG: hypothetical protein GKR93_14090 [Gammaproteobacteria bacterium]|nr:hypothetical protein [Gammaproteobacteria bacterium]